MFLELQDGIEVVGEAGDSEEGVREAQRLRPDVILMDLTMPGQDGVWAMQRLRDMVPTARIVVLTSNADDSRLLAAIRAGAAGYLLKNVQPQELARAVRTAHAGGALLDPDVAARLMDAIAQPPTPPPTAGPADQLTPRERQVLELIGEGASNKVIARALGVSEKTVKTHVGHILAKLGVNDRTQAAVLAARAGLRRPRS